MPYLQQFRPLWSRKNQLFCPEITIEDQGDKQIKANQDKRPIKSIEKLTYNINYSPIVLKEN